MSMMKEFKEFAMRGNVIDLAVGVVIGGAFGKIVSSVVNDIIMPPIGMAIGGVDFKELKLVLREAEGELAAVAINYGSFIQNVFDFLIVAFCIFMLVKGINSMNRKKEEPPAAPAAPPPPTKDQELLMEIRDLLRK
jgi:large conductance mechanosensitive channel